MSQELLQDGTIRVTEYTLPEFVFAIAELAARGLYPTMLNGSQPEGSFGSYYTAVLVPIDKFRIGLDGKRYNDPADKSTQVIPDAVAAKQETTKQTESTTEEVVKQTTPATKRTTTRK